MIRNFRKIIVLTLTLVSLFGFHAWGVTYMTWTAGSTTSTGGTGDWDTSTANWSTTSGQSTAPASTHTNNVWVNSTAANTVEADFRNTSTLNLKSDVAVSLFYVTGSGTSITINSTSAYTLTFAPASAGNLLFMGSGVVAAFTINANALISDVSGTSDAEYKFASSASVSTSSSFTATGSINVVGNSSSAGTKYICFDAAGGQTMTYSGSTTGVVGGTAKMGFKFGTTTTNNNGTYYISGTNSGVTGNVNIYRGSVVISNSAALGTGSVGLGNSGTTSSNIAALLMGTSGVEFNNSITLDTGGGTYYLGGRHTNGVSTFKGGVSMTAHNLVVTQAAGGVTDFSGQLYASSGTSSVTKEGAGVVRFTRGAGQAYLGVTSVKEGTLLVTNFSGNGVGSGAVTVGSGNSTLAYFGGNGLVGSAVTLNGGGALTPGDINTSTMVSNAEGLYLTAGLTWNSDDTNAGMYMQLGSSSATSDKVEITSGGFTKGTGNSFLFNISSYAGGLTLGETYTLLIFDSTTFTDASVFDLDAATQGMGIDGTFTLASGHLDFTVTAIPEAPTIIYLVVALCLGIVAGVRRRITTAS